jgi:Ca2+-binding EF-hand superfamily protein
MKRSVNPLLVAALFAAGAALATAEESGRPDGESRKSDGARHFIRKADTDGDGGVSREEFAALERVARLPEDKRAELFARLDKNGDGAIRPDELRMPTRRGGGPPLGSMKKLDRNGDGRVSFDEFLESPFVKRMPEARRRAFFDRLDRDGDGALTAADRRDRGDRGRRGSAFRRIFSRLDADGDGSLDRREFSRSPWHRGLDDEKIARRFRALDRDGDGEIGPREFLRAMGADGPGEKRGPRERERRRGPKKR